MLTALLVALALAPVYWLAVPPPHRRAAISAASLVAIATFDWRLAGLLVVLGLVLHALLRWMAARSGRVRWLAASAAFALLAALFVWNKTAATGGGALSSQGGLVFLGLSYLVLKIAAVLADRARDAVGDTDLGSLLSWLVFLPTYPSGPIEEFEHFRRQSPSANRERIGTGLERILFGLVKAVIVSGFLATWAQPALASPETTDLPWLLLAIYAFTLRFYMDFAGFSDVAIGLAAVYGYEIQENFDRPLLQRNLVQLWQRWHMTLTGWLRTYLFVPISRGIMRRSGPRFDTLALIAAQVATMTFCGLWHGVSWSFALWGFAQALGLVWVGVAARALGRWLPHSWLRWWRQSRFAHVLCVLLTFNVFSFSNVLLFSDLQQALRIVASLFGSTP
jgi:D-alanyl-lipoteichoic acid acyltransferase DltB (MBOAT superfamily)